MRPKMFCHAILMLVGLSLNSHANDYFTIEVVDEQTGRGVPLVELSTVNNADWWTDSSGIVAFNEPGLMDTEVFFFVRSPGYTYPLDMFRNPGLRLRPTPGGSALIKVKRRNIAERLYRITGQGIYRDSILAGRPVPLKHPALNGQVTGQDTVIATPYRGKIYWFWGDTIPARYPMPNFSGSGATSELPGSGGLDPGVGVDLSYFVEDSGFSKGVCPLPKDGLKWIEDLLTVPDEHGRERLLAHVTITTGDATIARYLMRFDDVKEVFEPIRRWEVHDPHKTRVPFLARVGDDNFYYLSPDLRVPDNLESIADLNRYDSFSCLAGDGQWHGRDTKVARDENGLVQYAWRTGAQPLNRDHLDELVDAGTLKREEEWSSMVDFETGTPLSRGVESTSWNKFRRRWITLFADKPGEVWFAEADTPLGPWGYARRVVTHGDYNFYNLSQHPFFDQEGGRLVYFEGTYSTTFSGARVATPRYDYNQIMYRLALDDPRLTLPLAVYRVRGTNDSTRLWLGDQIEAAAAWRQVEKVVCFALPPASRGTNLVPIYATGKDASILSITSPAAKTSPLFVGRKLTEQPVAGRKPGDALEGFWEAHVLMSNGNTGTFSFNLALEGEDVHLDNLGPDATGHGKFHDEKLTLTVEMYGGTYEFEARFDKRSLKGTWREKDSVENGTWSAAPWDLNSMVALKEYIRLADHHIDYFAQSQPPPGYEPTGRELCQVWKVPNSVLALNWKAKAVSVGGNLPGTNQPTPTEAHSRNN